MRQRERVKAMHLARGGSQQIDRARESECARVGKFEKRADQSKRERVNPGDIQREPERQSQSRREVVLEKNTPRKMDNRLLPLCTH